MNMKTWTNPSVEELEVKLTASFEDTFYHEQEDGDSDNNNEYWGDMNGKPAATKGPQS